jgi:hypothetical protein
MTHPLSIGDLLVHEKIKKYKYLFVSFKSDEKDR